MDLAHQFVAEVLELYERIDLLPRSGHPYIDDTRRALMPSFPYAVVYRLHGGNEVEVVAIAHLSRRSGYWIERD